MVSTLIETLHPSPPPPGAHHIPMTVGNKEKTEIILFNNKMERIMVSAQLESRGMKIKNWFRIYSQLSSKLPRQGCN